MERSELSRQMAEMTERLHGLMELQQRIAETARQVEDVLTFGTHPELASLDAELDILYRGQL